MLLHEARQRCALALHILEAGCVDEWLMRSRVELQLCLLASGRKRRLVQLARLNFETFKRVVLACRDSCKALVRLQLRGYGNDA